MVVKIVATNNKFGTYLTKYKYKSGLGFQNLGTIFYGCKLKTGLSFIIFLQRYCESLKAEVIISL